MTLAPRPSPLAPLRGVTVAVIGTGTMGQALIKGLLATGVPRRAIRGADPSAMMRRAVQRRCGIAMTASNRDAVRDADVVILAVKPQQLPDALADLASRLTRRQLVISIAAGVTLSSLQRALPGVPLVRVMPNLPATVRRGFSALAAGRHATSGHRALAAALFRAVGETIELPERSFDAITAVSGSGPAYVFFLVQAWEQAARALGLPPSVAARAVRQTVRGSVELLEASNEEAATLIARVASKGGTTEAALRVLAKRRVAAHIEEALRAAAARSKELRCRLS